MTETQDTIAASPFATLWLSPRATIEQIVTARPTYMVLPLAMAGTIAGLYLQVLAADLHMTDWRLWLALVLGGAILSLVWLYVSALILKWICNMLGGGASALQLRAVLAWSTVPTLACVLIAIVAVLLIKASGGGAAVVRVGLPLLTTAASLWGAIVFLLMLGRVERFGFWRTMLAYVLSLVLSAATVAIGTRTFLYQPFNSPSGSMAPTLLVGDYYFVAKYPYGYSRFSLPFSPPLFSGRILAAEPKRGDVVVFRLPKDEGTDYVKRLVGLPGEHIQMKDGVLYINDVAVKHEQIADFVGDACGSGTASKVKRWRETLPNGVNYETLDCADNGFYDNTILYTVPAGHYFMIGDNRDNSSDSRVLTAVGYIPLQNLIGRVALIYYSRDPETGAVRDGRIGTAVK